MRASLLACIVAASACGPKPAPVIPRGPAPGSACVEMRWHKQDYMARTGFNFGDSWMMTWAGDGKTYTNFSDGKLEADGDKPSNAIMTIEADPPSLTPEAFVGISADPLGIKSSWAHYIISTVFVGDTLYVGIVNFAIDSAIGRSDDLGKTLVYDRERPMWPHREQGVRFVYPSFLQNGRGYAGNSDGFMYVYGSDGNWGKKNSIRLARVAPADLLDIGAYEYFSGTSDAPAWSRDLERATDVVTDGDGTNLGGMQSIVYNPVHRRYFLATFGDPFNERARMVIYDSPRPWGPWTRCGVITKAEALFVNEDKPLFTAVYNPSFNAKWIESDGSMWISYANYTPQYSFHYGKISVVLRTSASR